MAAARAVLWDLDGVLVDSAREHYEAFRELFGGLGRPFDDAEFRSLFGLRNDVILQRVLGELSPAEVLRLAARKEQLFRRRIAGRVRALPGAAELVNRLAEAGVAQAIVSSTPRANIEVILAELKLERLFAVVVGEEDARRGKPHPEGFLTAAARLGVPPADCVVLEDAPEGVAAARAAGMRCLAVASTRPPEQLAAAELVVASLEDGRAPELLGIGASE